MSDPREDTSREFGDIGVSNDVFESIAILCTEKIAGVFGFETSEGLVDSLSKVWERETLPVGVKVTTVRMMLL